MDANRPDSLHTVPEHDQTAGVPWLPRQGPFGDEPFQVTFRNSPRSIASRRLKYERARIDLNQLSFEPTPVYALKSEHDRPSNEHAKLAIAWRQAVRLVCAHDAAFALERSAPNCRQRNCGDNPQS